MDLFKWMHNKIAASSNPFCKDSDWHPASLPRISQNGRVCGGCSYFSFASASCKGNLAGRKPEPGHSADFIISVSGSGASRTFSMRSPWTVTAGYKLMSGSGMPRAIPLIDTQRFLDKAKVISVHQNDPQKFGFMGSGYPQKRGTSWPEMQELLKAVSSTDKMPKFDAARLAGMFASHTHWEVTDVIKTNVLLPLARRAAQLSPNDPELLRLLFEFNSRRIGLSARQREAENAMDGVSLQGGEYTTYHTQDPSVLANVFRDCKARQGSFPKDKWTCHDGWGKTWFWSDKPWRAGNINGNGPVNKNNDPFFGLQMNASNSRGSIVERLVAQVRGKETNVVTEEFRELWAEFEEGLRGGWNDEDESAQLPLRNLLEELPSAHVNMASIYRHSIGEPLIELCPFSLVANAVSHHFPQAAPWVEEARKALTAPSRQGSKFLAGKAEDVDALKAWIAAGKPLSEVIMPDEDSGPAANTEWLKMMAESRQCSDTGAAVIESLDEAVVMGVDEQLREEVDEEEMVGSGVPPEEEGIRSDMDGMVMVQLGTGDVDSCYDEWVKSAAAKALKDYLVGKLH